MMDYETRLAQAQSVHAAGLRRVATERKPKGQKFPCGSRVRVADDLGPTMSHFESGVEATVQYVYAHAYGGNDVKSYCLHIDGIGEKGPAHYPWPEVWTALFIKLDSFL